jgi:hypothetical protein
MEKTHLRLVRPSTVNGTVPPRRRKYTDLRTREYLTETEIDRLIKSARGNRYGLRDATMILMAFRHAPRSLSTCAGNRSSWAAMPCCMCAGSSKECRVCIRCRATKCGPCAS